MKKVRIGINTTIGGYIDLEPSEVEAFKLAIAENRFDDYIDLIVRTHYEGICWEEVK